MSTATRKIMEVVRLLNVKGRPGPSLGTCFFLKCLHVQTQLGTFNLPCAMVVTEFEIRSGASNNSPAVWLALKTIGAEAGRRYPTTMACELVITRLYKPADKQFSCFCGMAVIAPAELRKVDTCVRHQRAARRAAISALKKSLLRVSSCICFVLHRYWLRMRKFKKKNE